jgi:hypothetical protein
MFEHGRGILPTDFEPPIRETFESLGTVGETFESFVAVGEARVEPSALKREAFENLSEIMSLNESNRNVRLRPQAAPIEISKRKKP